MIHNKIKIQKSSWNDELKQSKWFHNDKCKIFSFYQNKSLKIWKCVCGGMIVLFHMEKPKVLLINDIGNNCFKFRIFLGLMNREDIGSSSGESKF